MEEERLMQENSKTTLQCSACGAPLDNTSRCIYCRSLVDPLITRFNEMADSTDNRFYTYYGSAQPMCTYLNSASMLRKPWRDM